MYCVAGTGSLVVAVLLLQASGVYKFDIHKTLTLIKIRTTARRYQSQDQICNQYTRGGASEYCGQLHEQTLFQTLGSCSATITLYFTKSQSCLFDIFIFTFSILRSARNTENIKNRLNTNTSFYVLYLLDPEESPHTLYSTIAGRCSDLSAVRSIYPTSGRPLDGAGANSIATAFIITFRLSFPLIFPYLLLLLTFCPLHTLSSAKMPLGIHNPLPSSLSSTYYIPVPVPSTFPANRLR